MSTTLVGVLALHYPILIVIHLRSSPPHFLLPHFQWDQSEKAEVGGGGEEVEVECLEDARRRGRRCWRRDGGEAG